MWLPHYSPQPKCVLYGGLEVTSLLSTDDIVLLVTAQMDIWPTHLNMTLQALPSPRPSFSYGKEWNAPYNYGKRPCPWWRSFGGWRILLYGGYYSQSMEKENLFESVRRINGSGQWKQCWWWRSSSVCVQSSLFPNQATFFPMVATCG